jgi:hypothetical protein
MVNGNYVIAERDGAWTIVLGDRCFDRFGSEREATERALEWAKQARGQGHAVGVVVEQDDGRVEPLIVVAPAA